MKTIKMRIILSVSVLLLSSLIATNAVSIFMNYNSTMEILQQSLTETAVMTASGISNQLEKYRMLAAETGCIARLSNPEVSNEDKQGLLDERVAAYGLDRANIMDANGISIFNGIDYSDREYFQRSIKGETFVTAPMIGRSTGTLSVIIAAPLWKSGVRNSEVAGVLYFVPKEEFLNDMVRAVSVSPNSFAQVIGSDGTLFADNSLDLVLEEQSLIELAKSDATLADRARAESLQADGLSGAAYYEQEEKQMILAYAPIDGADGWNVGIHAQTTDFTQPFVSSIIIVSIFSLVMMVIGIIIAIALGQRIGRPVHQAADRLQQLANGDLTTPVPRTKAKDETGSLMRDLELCVAGLKRLVEDINFHLGEISEGNLTNFVTNDYPGEFGGIRISLKTIYKSLQALIGQVADSARYVAAAANEISSSASGLANASSEQAGTSASLTEAVESITKQATEMKEASQRAATLGREIQSGAETGNEQMQRMMDAVQEISDAGEAIEKVIRVIDDIAFQTNILALNAAVEAARAGEHGKGFAVVADEVRSLATKSAEAAKDTAQLISNTIQKSREGYDISHETSQSLRQIVDGVRESTRTIGAISENAAKQAEEIHQVNQGVQLSSQLSWQNNATSEETAATSEEMRGQSQLLWELVGRFKLPEDKQIEGLPRAQSRKMGELSQRRDRY